MSKRIDYLKLEEYEYVVQKADRRLRWKKTQRCNASVYYVIFSYEKCKSRETRKWWKREREQKMGRLKQYIYEQPDESW